MQRFLAQTFFVLIVVTRFAFGCDCPPPGPASEYLNSASVVFLGKVVFTDDDGSGTFTQQTFVRFQVEEAYKGIGPSVRQVWVDPGSYTSCYATYQVGERYLVFAYDRARPPKDTLGMSTAPRGQASTKPLPRGMDAKTPPAFYYAPECAGTRNMSDTRSDIPAEIVYLRRCKARVEKTAVQQP
jgi:hypothetical protein